MEEPKVRPGSPGDRSQAAAEKLRALRERANQALEGHRSRLGEIETELSERVRHLAEEFGTSLNAPPTADDRDAELAALRKQVDEANAKHARFVEQLAEAKKQLNSLQSQPCTACQQTAEELAVAKQENQGLRDQLEATTRQQQEERARHDSFLEQLTAARQAITVLQHSAGEATAELRAELETARAAKSASEDQLAAALRDQEALHAECDANAARSAQLESELAESQSECGRVATSLAEAEQLRQDAERRRDEAEAAGQLLAGSLAALQATTHDEHGSLREALAKAEAEAQEAKQRLTAVESDKLALSLSLSQAESQAREFQNALTKSEAKLNEVREQALTAAEAPELRAELEKAQAAAAARDEELAELAASLELARCELAALQDTTVSHDELEAARREGQKAQAAVVDLQSALEAAQAAAAKAESDAAKTPHGSRSTAEFAELQQKFDLALADVQKLKRDNGSLRDDLAQRPAASDQESPDLIAVRTERDALAARVAELETAAVPTPVVDADAVQEREDLQRRFEMAVDDVRQLKQENAQLRDKLSAAKNAGADAAAGGDGGDWASQRARLMAMLEQEDSGSASAERAAERATVAKTIAATDRVIADKDRELAELRAALESRPLAADEDPAATDEREQLLSTDEIIAAERQRLAQLAAEWEGKLRAAELEFSVERAKLAREQAALRDRAHELQSASPHPGEAGGEPGKPRRRWLSALGLGDEAEDAKKKS